MTTVLTAYTGRAVTRTQMAEDFAITMARIITPQSVKAVAGTKAGTKQISGQLIMSCPDICFGCKPLYFSATPMAREAGALAWIRARASSMAFSFSEMVSPISFPSTTNTSR